MRSQSDIMLCDAVVSTILRHLSLSSAALTASCVFIPEVLLMSLSHDGGGRPLFLFPLTFPVMIVLSSPFLRITCPKKHNFRLLTISRSINLFKILPKTHAGLYLAKLISILHITTTREQLFNGNILEYFGILWNIQTTPGYYGIFQIIVVPLYSGVFQNVTKYSKVFKNAQKYFGIFWNILE